MSKYAAILMMALIMMTPLGARGADLVVWWQKGAYAQEDEALAEIIAAFEQRTAKKVEVTFYDELELLPILCSAA